MFVLSWDHNEKLDSSLHFNLRTITWDIRPDLPFVLFLNSHHRSPTPEGCRFLHDKNYKEAVLGGIAEVKTDRRSEDEDDDDDDSFIAADDDDDDGCDSDDKRGENIAHSDDEEKSKQEVHC